MKALLLAALVGLGACGASYGGGRAVQPSDLAVGWVRAAPTPVIRQQHESDCGLAALAMVAGSWGMPWNLDTLERRVQPTPEGVRLGTLRDLARDHGLDAYVVRASIGDLAHELAAGRPLLVGLEMPIDKQRARNHYEVAIALNARDGSVVTVDPASGKWVMRSKDVFEYEWGQAGNATLVVVGRIPAVTTR
jgi:ABC-type bacteriocin/lantibiotic exporter with double-glycine peptidase domain